jgi:ubiquinone/menaquinone biosynthesis C-methylase UbiE
MTFAVVEEVPRICNEDNYTNNFGLQLNKFLKTQIDNEHVNLSSKRFFAETDWSASSLKGKDILEVGSGAGWFSRVVLSNTEAILYSVDYSSAVSANMKNNGTLAPDRFHLFQASIYELPFPDNSFDKVFCLGVLQHTPDFEASIKVLVDKVKPGSEVVVDFYPVKGWWTKIHSKYIFRPITKRLSHAHLMSLIEKNITWMIWTFDFLSRLGLGTLTRFLPITDIRLFPNALTYAERKEWAILDTFDGFSPEFDNPQRIIDVVKMFERSGANVTFSGTVVFDGGAAAVVRAIKQVKQ